MQSNGIFGLGIDNYILGATSITSGLYYDPVLEQLSLDLNKNLMLGYNNVGYNGKNGNGGTSLYGLFISNERNMVQNVISIGNAGSYTTISNIESIFKGDVYVEADILPEVNSTSNIGTSTLRFNTTYTSNLNISGNIIGNLVPNVSQVNTLGSPSLAWGACYNQNGVWSISDKRFKNSIMELTNGTDIITKLKPVSFYYNNYDDGLLHLGFLAQDLKKVFPNSVVFGNETDTSNYFVNYSELIPVITLCLKEQIDKIDSLKDIISKMSYFDSIKLDPSFIGKTKVTINKVPFLLQNSPNPFSEETVIEYFIPIGEYNSVFISIYDDAGRLIKSIDNLDYGYRQIVLDCQNMSDGKYYYSLIINGNKIETKSMILINNN